MFLFDDLKRGWRVFSWGFFRKVSDRFPSVVFPLKVSTVNVS